MPSNKHARFLVNYSVNFLSAILLIYLSKWLFRHYPVGSVTLSIWSCFSSALFATVALRFLPKTFADEQTTAAAAVNRRWPSFLRMLVIAGSFSAFITLSNLSLQHNTLGTYQLIKLQVPPTLMVVEWMAIRFGENSATMAREKFHRDYSPCVLFSFAVIVLGTLVNTYSDLAFHPLGVTYACISVLCNAIYQALIQSDRAVSVYDRTRFLQVQSFVSGCILLVQWPFIEPTAGLVKHVLVEWTTMSVLALCGVLAFLVNSSVIWCIKDDAAIGFNMVGQLKTLFIVFVGSVLFGELLTVKQVISILFTTAGCIIYVYVTYQTRESERKHQPLSAINSC